MEGPEISRQALIALKREIADEIPSVGVCCICEKITHNNQLLAGDERGRQTCEDCLCREPEEENYDNTGSERENQNPGPVEDTEYHW